MDIEFSCPTCQNKIKAQDDWIGMSARCPTCDSIITVPDYKNIEKKESIQPKKGSPSMKEIFKGAGKYYWQTCPHCNDFIRIEEYLDGYEVTCPKCKKGFIAQKTNQNQCQFEYKFQIFEFDEIPQGLATLSAEGWEVVSQSTIFLSEGEAGFLGISGGSRKEGIGYTLKRTKSDN